MDRMPTRKITSFALFTLLATGCAVAGTPVMIDVPAGTKLTVIRDQVRALSVAQRVQGVEVRLARGVFEMEEGLALEPQDSGTPDAPIIWRGAACGGTRLIGGRAIPADVFKPDPERPGVLVADVSDWQANWPAKPTETVHPYPVPELYVDGKRMMPAGWPDPVSGELDDWEDGWATFDKVVNPGTNGVDCGTFVYRGLRPDRWVNEKYAYVFGFWKTEWRADEMPIASIDDKEKTITLGGFHFYGLGGINSWSNRPRRWRVLNVLCELDTPGECYVDVEANKVYLIPRHPLDAQSQVRLCWQDEDIVSLRGVANVTICDLTIGPAWKNAVWGSAVTNVVIRNLTISGTRLKGIEFSEADHCRIADCTMYDLGAGGVKVSGGDRRNLIRGENVVENNLIHDFSKIRMTYAWAIQTWGVGDVVRHNEMYNTIHEALNVDGNDCLIEYNVISNAVTGTDDSGAFHCGRNISCRGNVFRHNLFANIGNPEFRAQAALYLDDGHSGWTIDGCIFRDVFRNEDKRGFGAIHCNGGYSNVVRNCLFINCGRALGSRWVTDEIWNNWLKEPGWIRRLKREVDIEGSVYQSRYPELKGVMQGFPRRHRMQRCEDNVVVHCREFKKGDNWVTNQWNAVVNELPPGDVNAACRQLIPHFQPIPFEKIGRYR